MCLPRSKRPASTRIALARFVPALTTSSVNFAQTLAAACENWCAEFDLHSRPLPHDRLAMPNMASPTGTPRLREYGTGASLHIRSSSKIEGKKRPAWASVTERTVNRAEWTGVAALACLLAARPLVAQGCR